MSRFIFRGPSKDLLISWTRKVSLDTILTKGFRFIAFQLYYNQSGKTARQIELTHALDFAGLTAGARFGALSRVLADAPVEAV